MSDVPPYRIDMEDYGDLDRRNEVLFRTPWLVVWMVPETGFNPDNPRWSDAMCGYHFTFCRLDWQLSGETIAPVWTRSDVVSTVESILNHINCDVESVESFGTWWLDHCFLDTLDVIEQTPDTTFVVPRFE